MLIIGLVPHVLYDTESLRVSHDHLTIIAAAGFECSVKNGQETCSLSCNVVNSAVGMAKLFGTFSWQEREGFFVDKPFGSNW